MAWSVAYRYPELVHGLVNSYCLVDSAAQNGFMSSCVVFALAARGEQYPATIPATPVLSAWRLDNIKFIWNPPNQSHSQPDLLPLSLKISNRSIAEASSGVLRCGRWLFNTAEQRRPDKLPRASSRPRGTSSTSHPQRNTWAFGSTTCFGCTISAAACLPSGRYSASSPPGHQAHLVRTFQPTHKMGDCPTVSSSVAPLRASLCFQQQSDIA